MFKKDDQHINECWLTGIFLSFVHTAITMQLPLSINEQAWANVVVCKACLSHHNHQCDVHYLFLVNCQLTRYISNLVDKTLLMLSYHVCCSNNMITSSWNKPVLSFIRLSLHMKKMHCHLDEVSLKINWHSHWFFEIKRVLVVY